MTALTAAEFSVLKERAKQRARYSSEHDDTEHPDAQLAYFAEELLGVVTGTIDEGCMSFPWLRELALKNTPRQNLVVAAAFIIANIEMIDRQSNTDTME